MKFYKESLADIATKTPTMEGVLLHKKPPTFWRREQPYRLRYFKLIYNFLFYFARKESCEPRGVFVMEAFEVFCESEGPEFGFIIDFGSSKHTFRCPNAFDVTTWVLHLRVAPYDHWRNQYVHLRGLTFGPIADENEAAEVSLPPVKEEKEEGFLEAAINNEEQLLLESDD